MDESWIKIYRSLLNWRWFKDSSTLHVFLFLLLSANVKDNDFQDIKVKRGQIVTSCNKISIQTGLGVQRVRTAINHLKLTGELTSKTYSKFSLFTIVNYDTYQDNLTGELTSNQHTTNTQLTSNQQATNNNQRKKERKNVRKEEYIYTAVAEFDADLQKSIADFYESRKKLNKPMTDRAVDLFLAKLRKIPSREQKRLVDEATEKGWLSIYPSQEKKPGQSVFSSDASYDLEEYRLSSPSLRGFKPKQAVYSSDASYDLDEYAKSAVGLPKGEQSNE